MQVRVGSRVRMVHTNSYGVVVAEKMNEAGEPRVSIRWDSSDKVTDWHPGFLCDPITHAANDPKEVIAGNTKKIRGGLRILPRGMTIFEPDRLVKI